MDTSTATGRSELRQPVLGLPDPGERVPLVAWPTVGLYVGTLALFALQAYGVLAHQWPAWVVVPMGIAVTFLMFSVLHEATHHAVSTNTKLNNAFGRISVPLVVPYATFAFIKFIHIEHHRNTNEAMTVDPDAWTSEGPWWQLPFRWATIDLWYVVFYLRRIRERPMREVVTVLITFTVVVGAMVTAGVSGYGTELVFGYLIPQRLGLIVLAWWFDYLPHHGLTATQREDKYQATRVRVGGEFFLTPLFVYQNYHLVHHLHPSVPFYRYLRAWRRNEEAYLDRNAAISTWFGRSLTPSEYRTWRRLTDQIGASGSGSRSAQRPVFHPLRVHSVAPLTSNSTMVTFEVPADLAYEYQYLQGQHITLRAVIDGIEVRRSYSLVAPVSANTLQVAVKEIEGGVFSGYVNRTLAAGDILDVMSPTGRFQVLLDSTQCRSYVAVVAGSGITPVMSIAATTLEAEPGSRFLLIYGNQRIASTMFREEIEALVAAYGDRLVVQHVYSRELNAELRGRVSTELVRRLVPDVAGVDAWFLCGPTQMVDELKRSLAQDTEPSRILSEVFHTENAVAQIAVDLQSQVIVALDGVESSFALYSSGETILDAALQRGIDAPYSCAGGACGTCKAKVLLGKVVMDQNHALDQDDIDAGYVLTCQAHPVSTELRIDYDA